MRKQNTTSTATTSPKVVAVTIAIALGAPGGMSLSWPAVAQGHEQVQAQTAQTEETSSSGAKSNLMGGSLTLAQATHEAEDNSLEIKRLSAEAERIAWTKSEALSSYMPHLGIGYDHYLESKYLRQDIVFGNQVVNFPAGYPQDNLTIDASITVFDGLDGYHKYRAASLQSEAAHLDLSRARFQVDQSVRLAYYRALAAQELFAVAQQNVKTLQEHLSRAQITEKAGYGTRFEVLRIEATLEEARADQEQAENDAHIARDTLAEAMGMDALDVRPLSGELPTLKSENIPSNITPQVANRDDLQSAQKKEEAMDEIRRASQGFWYPSVTVFAEQDYYKFGSFDPAILPNSEFQSASAIGIRLKWNLFDGGYSYAKQQEAHQAAIEAQVQVHKEIQQLPRDIDMWKRKLNYSISLYRARERAVTEYEESVRLAGIGVKAGSRTHTEMLDAELDLFRARGGLVKAQADAVEALSKLELALGRNL